MSAFVDMLASIWATFINQLPTILVAIIVLFVGWIIAKVLSSLVGRLTAKLTVPGKKLVDVDEKETRLVVNMTSRITYWVVMLFVLVQFFDILGITIFRGPFMSMAGELAMAIPNFIKAILILLLAFVTATLLRSLTYKAISHEKVAGVLRKIGVISELDSGKLASSTATTAYYLILLLFLPAVLSALQLEGLREPFQQLTASAIALLPRLAAAAVTLFIGYVAARVVQRITTHFLANVGTDKLPEKVGMAQIFEKTPLSQSLGTIVFILILLPVVISALESLGITAISQPAVAMLTAILNMVPNVAVALLLVAVGIALFRWIAGIVTLLLDKTNVINIVTRWGVLPDKEKAPQVAEIVGKISGGIVLLLILVEAFNVVHLYQISIILQNILAYVPRVIVAAALLIAGNALAQFAFRSMQVVVADTAYPAWLALAVKYGVLVVAGAMALIQAGISEVIVSYAFAILFGSLGLAAAISFGLGSKDVIQRWLDKKCQAGQDESTDKSA